jgi:membrane protein YdbS with pleckstrin-like domain
MRQKIRAIRVIRGNTFCLHSNLDICLSSFVIRHSSLPGEARFIPMEFLIHHDGREMGPYSESEVRSRLLSGAIVSSDLAWHEGAPDWAPLSSFPQFAGRPRSTPPPVPAFRRSESLIPPAPSPGTIDPAPSARPALDSKSLGSYTTATLQADERALHKTTLHWMVLVVPMFVALFTFLVIGPIGMIAAWKGQAWIWLLLVIPVAIVASAVLGVKTSELVITDRRVLIKVGFIRRQTFEMFISKIESVAVTQGMLGRFFNYGTVEIRGTGSSAESFATIVAPLQFRDAIQLVQSQSERR